MDGQTLRNGRVLHDDRNFSWIDRSGFASVRYVGLPPINLITQVDWGCSNSLTLWVLPESTILHRELVA